jgi:hypothetical protein
VSRQAARTTVRRAALIAELRRQTREPADLPIPRSRAAASEEIDRLIRVRAGERVPAPPRE